MARIFITGSADGLGQLSAQLLVSQGHQVVLHARNAARAKDAMKHVPGAAAVLTADLSHHQETKDLAAQANALGRFDAVIHNAGVYQAPADQIFAVNIVAPYVLTSLMQKPKRLIYLSSGMHLQGRLNFDQFENASISYADSKLHVIMLMLAIARTWQDVYSNAVNPGWVPTKMGGKNAPDNLQQGYETQSWLAVSNDEEANTTGHYFFHMKPRAHNPLADDVAAQDKLLQLLSNKTGISFPA